MRYLIVIEKSASGYCSYSPDIPGCVSTGISPEETKMNMCEAIAFHIKGLKQEGCEIPSPTCSSSYIEIEAA